MRTAAEFSREVAHAQHANAVVVFLAEQCHRAFLLRRLEIHDIGFDWQVTTDLRIHQIFHRADF